MTYDAADYQIPSVKGENVESMTFGVPRKKWQRRLSWLVPAWRKYRTIDVGHAPEIRFTYEVSGSFFVDDK